MQRARWANATDEQRQKDKERQKRYKARHPDRVLATAIRNQANRSALKKAGGESISSRKWKAIFATFDSTCAYCRTRPATDMDHFEPLSKGGRHVLSNLVPACNYCNTSKKDRDPFQWMEWKNIDSDFVVAMICETRHAA